LFSSIAHAGKDEFIENILPEIHKAKAEMGGQAQEVPNSLIIAQAGLESGWGTSLITKTKNNILGLTKGGKEYASFSSLKDGFKYYLKALTTHPLHEKFRDTLEKTQNSLRLIHSLESYAEDSDYQKKIHTIIVKNNLRRFDV
jgi:Bax protein